MKEYFYFSRKYLCQLLIITLVFTVLLSLNNEKVYADLLDDGDWDQSGSPGTTTVTFTNITNLQSGNDIVLTFPSATATVTNGTDIAVTGQTGPIRTNNLTNNTIIITLDTAIPQDTSITITMTDGLSAYTSTTYAQDSVAINTQDSSDVLLDFGLAIITNDNTTTVTASVGLFINMAIDTTTINLGTLSTASVNEADQTYTFNSNNNSGILVEIETDGTLNDGNGNNINYVGDTSVTAGQEEYGISVDNVSGLNIHANYSSNDNPIIQAANEIANSAGSISGATFDINYKASISGTTVAGDYDQIVTVTVSSNS